MSVADESCKGHMIDGKGRKNEGFYIVNLIAQKALSFSSSLNNYWVASHKPVMGVESFPFMPLYSSVH